MKKHLLVMLTFCSTKIIPVTSFQKFEKFEKMEANVFVESLLKNTKMAAKNVPSRELLANYFSLIAFSGTVGAIAGGIIKIELESKLNTYDSTSKNLIYSISFLTGVVSASMWWCIIVQPMIFSKIALERVGKENLLLIMKVQESTKTTIAPIIYEWLFGRIDSENQNLIVPYEIYDLVKKEITRFQSKIEFSYNFFIKQPDNEYVVSQLDFLLQTIKKSLSKIELYQKQELKQECSNT